MHIYAFMSLPLRKNLKSRKMVVEKVYRSLHVFEPVQSVFSEIRR